MHIKRTQVAVIAGLLLLLLVLPQPALADGPAISGVSYTVTEPTAANISWTTNNVSDSLVRYGTTTPLINYVYNSSYVESHLTRLEGLIPDTTYYFEVQSTDASGTSVDNNGTKYYSFRTTPPPVGYYSIALAPVCGVCGELDETTRTCSEVIGITAIVSVQGTYHISWDIPTNVKETFTTDTIGSYSLAMRTPEATKGPHTVYLVDNAYAPKVSATFVVLPFVRMNPEEGPVGTNVTFNGNGFVASQQIQIKFKGGVIGSTTASAVGSWMIPYTIPATPGGSYTFAVEAKEGTDFWPWVLKNFKVTPKIAVSSSGGIVGQAVAINGTGFGSKEKDIEVTFGGKIVKKISYAEENGSWGDVIAVPPVQRGDYKIDASGTSTRARDVQDVMFTVNAGILVDPISAYIGDTITVVGGGFAIGETGIQVYFDDVVVSGATITANSSGCWQSSFTLPVSTYGSHIVKASGDITQPAVTKSINTKARILAIGPKEGARGDFISLTGNGFHGSQRLTVTVGGARALETLTTSPNGDIAINFRVPSNSVLGQQPVWVTDEGGATGSINLTVIAKTLSIIPLPISPKDSTLRSGMVTFRWQGTTGGTGYNYTLEVSGEGGTWSKPIAESTYSLTKDEALPKGTYHWRVKIADDYGNEGPWSESIEFRVSPIPTWVWVVVGLVVLVVLLVVAYRETRFRVTE